jgi:hypothetical protein
MWIYPVQKTIRCSDVGNCQGDPFVEAMAEIAHHIGKLRTEPNPLATNV